MMYGELSSCSSGHSGCCSPGFGEKESSKYGLGFSHAALSSNNIPAGLAKTASNPCPEGYLAYGRPPLPEIFAVLLPDAPPQPSHIFSTGFRSGDDASAHALHWPTRGLEKSDVSEPSPHLLDRVQVFYVARGDDSALMPYTGLQSRASTD